MTQLLSIPLAVAPAKATDTGNGLPFLRLAFRPFYLAAAIAAVVLVTAWLCVLTGHLALPAGVPPVLWHAHEMLFGFVTAVVVGFLLTAGRVWTGLPTPRGAPLVALVGLWFAGRLAAVAAPHPAWFALDIAFLPAVAIAFTTLLLRANNQRNLPIAGVLLLLFAANLAFHAGVAGVADIAPLDALHAALGLLIVLVSILAGRVIPAFTRGAIPTARLREPRWLGPAAIATTAIGLCAWIAFRGSVGATLVLALAALLQLTRWLAWSPWATRRRPILWILHLSYAWLPLGLGLLAAAQAGFVAESSAIHALGIGAMGGMIIGMMTRTARGHTGRQLVASRWEVTAYALVMLAATVRVLATLVPGGYLASLLVAGAAWALAFAIYVVRFGPWLAAPRLDGQDG
jgi:uncharacterized protein involved in response to NO